MSKKKPVILVTNDDGITAKGIAALVHVAKRFGEVVVVAPDSPQSGMGHAITIGQPLRLKKSTIFKGIESYECSGTPVDCVKLAVDKVIGKKPDLCLSGVNHGSNSSINIIYSGTMSAAMEAAIEGIPAVGFSFLDYAYDADFTLSKKVVSQVLKNMFAGKLPMNALYNVNIPKVSTENYQGLKVCRQANAKWQENFVERKDPMGHKYYWLTGQFKNSDRKKDTDEYALKNNFASVVPVQFDLTNYDLLNQIEL
jgi:5'-nucleotidase